MKKRLGVMLLVISIATSSMQWDTVYPNQTGARNFILYLPAYFIFYYITIGFYTIGISISYLTNKENSNTKVIKEIQEIDQNIEVKEVENNLKELLL